MTILAKIPQKQPMATPKKEPTRTSSGK